MARFFVAAPNQSTYIGSVKRQLAVVPNSGTWLSCEVGFVAALLEPP